MLKHSCLDSTPRDCDSAGLQQGPWICIPSKFPWGCCGYCRCVPHTLESTAWLLCSIPRLNNDRSAVRMTAFLRASLCGCIACALSNCTWNLRGWGAWSWVPALLAKPWALPAGSVDLENGAHVSRESTFVQFIYLKGMCMCVCVYAQPLICVRFFATPWL